MAVRILVINGANMNMLGRRDVGVLGGETLDAIMEDLELYAKNSGVETEFFQSNSECEIINAIQKAAHSFQGILLNPGSFGHYSFGIREAIDGAGIPVIEVHLSNFFRKPENRSVMAPVCKGVVCGFGGKSYHAALDGLVKVL